MVSGCSHGLSQYASVLPCSERSQPAQRWFPARNKKNVRWNYMTKNRGQGRTSQAGPNSMGTKKEQNAAKLIQGRQKGRQTRGRIVRTGDLTHLNGKLRQIRMYQDWIDMIGPNGLPDFRLYTTHENYRPVHMQDPVILGQVPTQRPVILPSGQYMKPKIQNKTRYALFNANSLAQYILSQNATVILNYMRQPVTIEDMRTLINAVSNEYKEKLRHKIPGRNARPPMVIRRFRPLTHVERPFQMPTVRRSHRPSRRQSPSAPPPSRRQSPSAPPPSRGPSPPSITATRRPSPSGHRPSLRSSSPSSPTLLVRS